MQFFRKHFLSLFLAAVRQLIIYICIRIHVLTFVILIELLLLSTVVTVTVLHMVSVSSELPGEEPPAEE